MVYNQKKVDLLLLTMFSSMLVKLLQWVSSLPTTILAGFSNTRLLESRTCIGNIWPLAGNPRLR